MHLFLAILSWPSIWIVFLHKDSFFSLTRPDMTKRWYGVIERLPPFMLTIYHDWYLCSLKINNNLWAAWRIVGACSFPGDLRIWLPAWLMAEAKARSSPLDSRQRISARFPFPPLWWGLTCPCWYSWRRSESICLSHINPLFGPRGSS